MAVIVSDTLNFQPSVCGRNLVIFQDSGTLQIILAFKYLSAVGYPEYAYKGAQLVLQQIQFLRGATTSRVSIASAMPDRMH
jgi:hypothetical protein